MKILRFNFLGHMNSVPSSHVEGVMKRLSPLTLEISNNFGKKLGVNLDLISDLIRANRPLPYFPYQKDPQRSFLIPKMFQLSPNFGI